MEGKKKYFALVLFLFLGLMIFTFANPVEEEKEFIDGDNEQSEKVESNKDKNNQDNQTTTLDEDETTEGQQNIQNNVTNNTNNTNNNNNNDNGNTQNREEDHLGKALAAVEKAEASYSKEDVENAKELVNNVTDPTEKGKLQNRLDEVEAGIAVLELLEQLEKQVEEATEKTDMTEAKNFRDENEIADKIAALTNENVAEELQKRLEEVSKLLDDNKAPVINVEEKAYQENVKVSAVDEEGNDFTLYLTKDSEEEKEIENNTSTTSEGIYVVRAIDEAFNESAPVRFIVDWTDPVFKNLTNGGHYKEVIIEVEDLSKVVIKVTNMDKNETSEVENGAKLTEEATYKLEAEDEAGNKTTYWVAIDNTRPTISTTDNSFINYTKWTEVKDKFLTLVKIKREAPNGEVTEETFTRANFEVGARNENFKFRYKLKEEGKYTIYAEDKYGNYKQETVTVDKTAAKAHAVNINVNGYKNNIKEQYATNGNTISAYISINEELKHNPTFTFFANGKEIKVMKDEVVKSNSTNPEYPHVYTATLEINEELVAEDGLVTFTVTDIVDKAGNKTSDLTKTTTNKVITLDRTAAARVYSTIRSKATAVVQENKKDIDYYHKNGTEFEYAISFNELLKEAPTVTIAGRNVEMKLNEKVFNNENKFLYEGTFKIAEDEAELVEGILEIKVTNIKDLAGNETTLGDQTKTSNGRRVIYDRTPATIKSADFYVSGLTQIEKTFYTQYGKKIVANITTDEELGQNPTFTLHNNGKDYVVEDVIYRGLNDKGYHLYRASYELTKETGMTDGEITFTASNIKDLAGNTTADVTKPTNGRRIVLDNVGPVADKLAIRGAAGEWSKDRKEYKQYAKEGTIVYVEAYFKEELATTPVITLNDKVKLTKATKRESNGIWIYSYSHKVGADDLEEGEIQVKATNCKDYAGNETVLTNADLKMTSQRIVIVDRTAPTFNIYKDGKRPVENVEIVEYKGKLYFNDDAEIQFHDNYRLNTVATNDVKPYQTTYGVTGQIKYVREDGEYKYVATDRAGNQTTVTVVRDTVAPTVKEHSYIGENPYSGMSFKLSDNNAIDKFVLNGKEYERTNNKTSDANYTNIKSQLKNGKNELVLYDIAGNTTIHEFNLDRKKPTITVKDTSEENGENAYKKLNLSFHDENGVAFVVINGEKIIRTGEYVDIDDGHAYTFKDGENTVSVTDKAGNTTTEKFTIDRTFYIYNMDDLKEASAYGMKDLENAEKNGAKLKAVVMEDFEITEQIGVKAYTHITLDMNGHKFTVSPNADPAFYVYHLSKLTITGNGTFDLEDNLIGTLIAPVGEVVIENGTFLKDYQKVDSAKKYGTFFMAMRGNEIAPKVTIYDGYFDGGFYDENDLFNNSFKLLNTTWGQTVKVYGGTFVGQNPAYGDEAKAATSPVSNPTDCQGTFFEGQKATDTEIPSTYKVEEGTLADGRPTYKVIYTPAE